MIAKWVWAGAACALALAGGCARTATGSAAQVRGAVSFDRGGPSITVRRPALYPETIEYDGARDRFLLSSLREGGIFAVDNRGQVTQIVDDPRLCSVLGIAIDAAHDRLWAVNADLGASTKPSSAGPKRLAGVGIYDLSTGQPRAYVDVSSLAPGPHLLNGIAVDAAGNAYVTDSFSPNIYKVDGQGTPSLFLSDARFAGPGINLNGLVVHPDGYLLVVKKSDGSLFKIPLADPTRFTQVALAQVLLGGDGLTLASRANLIVVANQIPGTAANAAHSLVSDDGWATAHVQASVPLGDVYPTTSVLRAGEVHVVASKLNQLLQAPPAEKARLQVEATIQKIGQVAH